MEDHIVLGTFAWSIVLGIFFIQVAHKIRISSIVVLLIGGILVGPTCIGIIQPQKLSHEALKTIVAIAVGLILFEGGLTLNIREYRKVSGEIKGLLTIGVLVTFVGSALSIHLLFPHFEWSFCFLAASLVIVTGPTVIGPLLKKIHAQKKLSNILHWEGVLIDPIGVFVALLCYEWIVSGGEHAVILFLKRISIGIAFGVVSGAIITFIVKKSWVESDKLNIFVLAMAIATFTISESVAHESGLLSVVISGFLIGCYFDQQSFEQVKVYKAQLIEVLIGMLFVLLAANLDVYSFQNYGWQLFATVLLLITVVRPVNVFLSTLRSDLQLREKLFLSWIAPRGIVAASMASLFAISLKGEVFPQIQVQFLETFTFCVIIATVLIQGLTAKAVGKALKVITIRPDGWLVIGAHKLGREIASFIHAQNIPVLVMDTNRRSIRQSQGKKLITLCGSALTARPEDYPQLYDVGYVLAITPNESLNVLICQHFHKQLPDAELYTCREIDDDKDTTNHPIGTSIWTELPVRRILNFDDDEKISLINSKVNAKTFKNKSRTLLYTDGKQVLPFYPDNADENNGRVLQYSPVGISTRLNLREEWVTFSRANELNDLLEEMLSKLLKDSPQLSVEEIAASLPDDSQENTLMFFYYDIVVFYCYHNNVEEQRVAIAKTEEPITMVRRNIRNFVIVLSPVSDLQKHLQSSSNISRFLANSENRKKLCKAQDVDDLLRIFF